MSLPPTDWGAAMGVRGSSQLSKLRTFEALRSASGWSVQGGNAVVQMNKIAQGFSNMGGSLSGITGSVLKANVAFMALSKAAEPLTKAIGAISAGFDESTSVIWDSFNKIGGTLSRPWMPMFEDWATTLDEWNMAIRDRQMASQDLGENIIEIGGLLSQSSALSEEFQTRFNQMSYIFTSYGITGTPITEGMEQAAVDLLEEIKLFSLDNPSMDKNTNALNDNTVSIRALVYLINNQSNVGEGGDSGGGGRGSSDVNITLEDIINRFTRPGYQP